jgi:hypothetical protein
MPLIARRTIINKRPVAPGFVPTALLPILCAMLTLLVIHHVLAFSSEIVIWIPTAANEYPRGARGISPEFANPSTQTMILVSMLRSATRHAAFTGFSYVVIAHFVLRWLDLTSIRAYGAGGLCTAFAVAAYWSVLGYRLSVESLVLELACGAIAGIVYRLIAGRKPLPDARGLPEGQVGATAP